MNLDVKMTSSSQFIFCGNMPVTKIAGISEYPMYGAKRIFILAAGDCCIHGRLLWLKGTLQLSELVSRYFLSRMCYLCSFGSDIRAALMSPTKGRWPSGDLCSG